MTTRRTLPTTASVANSLEDGRLHAPSAERNRDDIARVLSELAPGAGRALELASGTGQHVIAFARAMPGLDWHPTEADPARRASIEAWLKHEGLEARVAAPRHLDALAPGWGRREAAADLIVLSNLLHLISEAEARTLVGEAAHCLAPAGVFAIYGPFRRAGELTSEGDRSFDASLRASDPEIGYKDDFDVIDWAVQSGLEPLRVVEMPANNLLMAFRR